MSLSVRARSLVLEQSTSAAASEPMEGREPSLLERLAQTLEQHCVRYCQWKGHWSAHRWTAGRGDVDLLVDHDSSVEFRRLMGELGFKPVLPPASRRIPGVESYFGHDPAVPRLLHLHVHYRLVIGDSWKTTYRVPIEAAMLDSSVPGSLFRVPDPSFQYVVFVLRMMLLQCGRPMLALGARWRRSIQIQLDNLEGLTEQQALASLLSRHLPAIEIDFFRRCVASLRGEAGIVERLLLPDLLHVRLRPYARRPALSALASAAAEKLLPASLRDRLADPRMRPEAGGAVIALVGGDGAGKSTAAAELTQWLGNNLATRHSHLGHPSRSLLTLAAGVLLKLEQGVSRILGREAGPASTLEMVRHFCTARDCYLDYVRLQRFAADGGVGISERYPVPQVWSHGGPMIPALLPLQPSRLASWLARAEQRYYRRIVPPDTLLVLHLHPELAVLRKPDEPADYVRARSIAIREADWTGSGARFVDTSRELPEVIRELKALVWSAL